jgi:protein-export membrane protein SecD
VKSKSYVVSLAVVLLFSAAGALGLTVFKARPKLGLDLRGGLSVTLTAKGKTTAEVLDKTVEVIRERVDSLGAQEPDISRSGNENIIVALPGVKDPERALRIIGQTAQLRFREVIQSLPAEEARKQEWQLTEADPPDREVIFRERAKSGDRWYKLGKAEVYGDQVRNAFAQFSESGSATGWIVQLQLTGEGGRRFGDVTTRLSSGQKQLAIVLDRIVESAPQVREPITNGQAQISGTFSEREARDLALVLKTGALPIELERSQVQKVSATLGSASLRAGLLAGAIGLGLVIVYMLLFYRLLGLITIFGLVLFGCLVLGLIGLIGSVRGFTLTLAGIAGIIVSIGIAADSYIIYFERVKDELKEGKTFRSAVDRGFSSALKTNVAANSVAFAAAIILYLLAVGSVRGFALTLGISALFDIILLYFYTHPAVALIARNRRMAGLRAVGMREAAASS